MTCVYVLRLLPARNRLRPPPTADAPLHSLSPARSRKAHSDPDLLSLSAMFGRSPAITEIIASTSGYLALIVMAWRRGMPVAWIEEGWLLALYLLVALNGMALQASANRRLTALVDLFAAAQRGDFSRPFVEERDREPDGITLLGRSYNHLRSQLASIVSTDALTGCL